MSHSPERKEKDCLNCGTIVQGRYCQHCGQENVVPKESFWGLVIHFFYDITHFDSKFFDTIKYLLFKPGFLTQEYMRGRRQSYLHPVRMYVFTSALFFLIFFAFKDPVKGLEIRSGQLSTAQRDSVLQRLENKMQKDSANLNLKKQFDFLKDTSHPVFWTDIAKLDSNRSNFRITNNKFATVQSYDSAQAVLPVAQKDGWLKRKWVKKEIELNNRYRNQPEESMKDLSESFLHRLPYLLFISLPFFALILKLLYIRRKQFYYADHAIFSIHHYIFSFLLLLFVFAFDTLNTVTGYGIFNAIMGFLFFAWPLYLYLAMRRFYSQGWFKTFIKFMALNILGLAVMVLLFIGFILFSVFQL